MKSPFNAPKAIVIGAIVIAASIVFANTMHTAQAQRVGPFQLMHHSNTAANAGVFRMDESTGDVSYCYITPNVDVVCSKPVH